MYFFILYKLYSLYCRKSSCLFHSLLPPRKGHLSNGSSQLSPAIKSLTSSPKRRRFNTTECWTSTPYHLVPTDNCKCQNKSLFSYETTSGVKVPQTNCISMHGNPMFFINQPLVLNSWIGVPELQKKSPWKLTATVSAVKATKRSLPCIAVLVPGSNAFGVAYF